MAQKKLIIFIDSGDTLIDEGTEQRGPDGIVYHAELIEGAGEMLRTLHDRGHTIALVADGEEQSFTNMYIENGLGDCFAVRSISQCVGIQKPGQAMFQTALDMLGLSPADKARIIMVGNNVRKDIVGANRFGIVSVLLDWSPRYDMTIHNDEEKPDYVISTPMALLDLVETLEAAL